MDNYIQCESLETLCHVVAMLVREGINYLADTETLRVHTTGGF